jgi:adenosine kinase
MRFLVHGSIAFDVLLGYEGSFADAIDPKSLDRLSVSFFAPRLKKHFGGTGANIAWNAALLGDTPHLVGAVGDDGDSYLSMLQKAGVDTAFVNRVPETVTATAVIGTDTGERQIAFFHPGADSHGTLPSLTSKKFEYAVIGARDQMLMLKACDDCHAANIPYLFDPGQQSHAFTQEEWQHAVSGSSGLVVNEYEWSLASKKLEWNEAEVVQKCGLLVITLGEKGLRLITPKEDVHVPACKASKVIDPTGAGDGVRAALLHGIAHTWSLTNTGRLAAIIGSFIVECEGTQLKELSKTMIQERATKNYGAELPL